MINKVPIYEQIHIGQIVGYHDLYPERMTPNIRKYIRSLRREELMRLTSNFAKKLVNKPFFNPKYGIENDEIDALRFFFSRLNGDYISETLKRFDKLRHRIKQQPYAYLSASEDSLLYFLRDIFSVDYKASSYSRTIIEKDYFKAIFAANQIVCERGRGDSPFSLQEYPELYYSATLLKQFASNNYHYNDILLATQTIKCIKFFEFAESHPILKDMVPYFCEKFGLDGKWWYYPKAIWELEVIFRDHVGIIDFDEISTPSGIVTKSVAIRSSIDMNAKIDKKNNRDYTVFRANPLIRIDENRFFLFNHNLLIEHIYNSLYFEFKDIAEKKFKFKGQEYNRLFTTDFSEECLFTSTLKKIFTKQSDISMSESQCIEADKSNDASNAGAPDFYARKGNVVFLFENKDLKMKDSTKELGTLDQYLEFIHENLIRNKIGKPKGVGQLYKNILRIRTGEFQKRWDPNCPQDAIIYPILVLADVKQTMVGVKNLLQFWSKEELPKYGLKCVNINPIILTDIATLCLYQQTFSENNFKIYCDDYYAKSSINAFIKSNRITDLFNGLAAFPEYMKTQHNKGFKDFAENWIKYIKK